MAVNLNPERALQESNDQSVDKSSSQYQSTNSRASSGAQVECDEDSDQIAKLRSHLKTTIDRDRYYISSSSDLDRSKGSDSGFSGASSSSNISRSEMKPVRNQIDRIADSGGSNVEEKRVRRQLEMRLIELLGSDAEARSGSNSTPPPTPTGMKGSIPYSSSSEQSSGSETPSLADSGNLTAVSAAVRRCVVQTGKPSTRNQSTSNRHYKAENARGSNKSLAQSWN